jgi:Outer membrane cobalamin receptor protein
MLRTAALALALLVSASSLAARPSEEEDEPSPVKAEVGRRRLARGGGDGGGDRRRPRPRGDRAAAGRSLADLLRYLPAVDVRRRGPGVQADVSLRGADYNGTLILVDGEPVNDPQTNHHSLDLDVPADAIERIEVLYGSASALWGSEAVGGVIHVVTRGASLGRARAQIEGRYVHGSHSLDAGSVRVATRLSDSLTVSVDASRSESSGFRDDREHAEKTVRASLRLETAAGPVTLSGGGASRAFGAWGFYGTRYPNQHEETRSRSLRLAADLSLGGGWTLAPSVSVRDHRDDFVLERTDPSFYRNLHDTDRSAVRLVARRPFLGGSLALGGETGRDAIDSTNLGRRARTRSAAFVELARPFVAASPSAGGVRAGLRTDRHEGFGTRLSPQLAAWVGLGAGVKARASVGTAFRVPTFTELHYVDPQTIGNPSLRPEKSTSFEAGLSWDHGALSFDAAVFHRHGTDLVDFVRSGPDEPYRATNLRTVDTRGLEATVVLDAARLAPTPLARLAFRAAVYSADLESSGPRRARPKAATSWTPADALGPPRGGPQSRSAWRRSRASRTSTAPRSTRGSSCSTRARYDVVDGDVVELYVEGENLGGVRYEEVPGVPLPGRTVAAGVRLTW